MAKIAINGLGRIGRAVLKIIMNEPELDLVAVNDLVPPENLSYLLKYDSIYRKYEKEVKHEDNAISIDNKKVLVFNSKDPVELPWGKLGIDIVFECTGLFTKKEGMEKHLKAGAKVVLLSTQTKDESIETVVVGVNKSEDNAKLISCASCTTNCVTPVVEVMGRRIGIKKAVLMTVHAYTSSQKIVDSPSKKFRRGRAGAANLVPTTTGAADATTHVLPQYKNKFKGIAVRAPVITGSLADITFVTSRPTSEVELTTIFKEEAQSERYRGVLLTTDEPIVSSDIIKDSHASIVDLEMIQVVDGDLVKILSWYDNEWGYASQMVRQALILSRKDK